MRLMLLWLAALPLIPISAMAQQGRQAPAAPAAPTPPPPNAPDRTAAQFGDWTMRCEASRGATPGRACEILQDARGQPVAQIVVGRLSRAERWRLLVQLPLEVRVEQPARVFAETADGEAVALPFRVCSTARGGCFADLELPDDAALRRFRARAEGQGRIEFQDAGGRPVQALFGSRGFGDALDALIRGE
jgi:invasion protein IalB